MNHTPTPWWADEEPHIHNSWPSRGIYAGTHLITRVCGNERNRNAEFIVKCVNAHDKLVESLKDALATIIYLAPEKFDDEEHEADFNAGIDKIRAALKRAEGEAQ